MIHTYQLNGYNIVLDVASGSIHNVDRTAFDAIRLFEAYNNRELGIADTAETAGTADSAGSIGMACMAEPTIVGKIKDELTSMHPELSSSEADELLSEIVALIKSGKLFAPDTYCDIPPKIAGAPLKALCLNVSHLCNMRCLYCFAGKGEYGGAGGLMSPDTGKRAIDFLIENSRDRSNLDVDFFGGEPLLNFETVKELVRYASGLGQTCGKNFRFTLTTNGLLIDDEVIDFVNREIHNVVLSLDGRPETHDATRKLPGGEGSYARVVPAIKKLIDARNGRDYYIRGTFTKANIDFVQDILHIADLGFTELSMEPVVSKSTDDYALSTADLPELERQYELLATEMLQRRKEGRGFSFYHYTLDLKGGPCIYKRIAGCGAGTEYMAVTPSGDLYPCHQFVGNERFLLGDVRRGLVNKALQDEFGSADIYSRQPCRQCWARMYCSGGCAANAYNATGSVGGIYELGCLMFKKRIECAIMIKVAEYAEDI